MIKRRASVQLHGKKLSIGSYDTKEQAKHAKSLAKSIIKELGNSCRTWHVDDVVNEYRKELGLNPIIRNA